MNDKNFKKCVLKVFNFVKKIKFLKIREFFFLKSAKFCSDLCFLFENISNLRILSLLYPDVTFRVLLSLNHREMHFWLISFNNIIFGYVSNVKITSSIIFK